jgi:cell shape-determining protein MreC
MRTRDARRKKRRTILAVLLGASVVGLLFPGVWLTPLLSVVQIFVPLQHAVVAATDAVSDRLADAGSPPSAGEVAGLRSENRALRNHLAAIQAALSSLQVENARLAGIRQGGLGETGRLIPARVISSDMHGWRDSRLINSGSLRGVRAGAPVTTNRFADYQALEEAGVRGGMAVLLGEALVGEVEEHVGTHTARVRLLSDPESRLKIQIGRYDERIDEGPRDGPIFTVVREASWLVGVGKGRMEILDIHSEDFTAGLVRVGDTVTSHPSNQLAPAALVVGEIVEIRPDRSNPLLCIATVKSPLDESQLRRVYVYDPG